MNTLVASIKFDQLPEVGDDLSVKIYRRESDKPDAPQWYAVSTFCNDELLQCLDNFTSYEAACGFAFKWIGKGEE